MLNVRQSPRPRPPAFFVNGRPDVAVAIQVGVNWLNDWTAEHGGVPLIITPGREPERRVLQAAPQAGSVTRQTFRTMFHSPWQGGAVLAIWSDDKALGRIDDDYRVRAVCAVLDSLTYAPLWLKAWQPVEIGGGESVLPPAVEIDPVARIALEHLTHSVNLSTGLVHPNDRSLAIDYLRALHAGRKKLSPDNTHAWAIQNRWRADGAAELRDLVIGVAAGKHYRYSRMARPSSELLAMWEREAASE
jgi:hypothetical protein